jgi:hypothetical protein
VKFYLVSFAHTKGFGNRLVGWNDPISEDVIREWSVICAENTDDETVCLIAISEIDGPVTHKGVLHA